MKKFIIALSISAPLFVATPLFAATSSTLYNPETRTDSVYAAGTNNLPTTGANYAYWHRWHHWHHWHHRHWHHWRHW